MRTHTCSLVAFLLGDKLRHWLCIKLKTCVARMGECLGCHLNTMYSIFYNCFPKCNVGYLFTNANISLNFVVLRWSCVFCGFNKSVSVTCSRPNNIRFFALLLPLLQEQHKSITVSWKYFTRRKPNYSLALWKVGAFQATGNESGAGFI